METGLIKTTNNLAEISQIKSALQKTKIKDAIPYEIDSSVSAAIEKAMVYLGLKTLEEDRDVIKIMVIDDVKKYFTGLTIDEIGIAIDNGVKGKYGEVFGLAPKDVFNWMTLYSNSQERVEVKVQIEKEGEQRREPTDDEKANMAWGNLVQAWHFYKANGYFNDFGNSIYNTLLINDKINFTKEQKLEFKRYALSNLEKQYNPLQHMGNVVKINEARAIIDEIRSSDHNSRLIAESKKIALNKFFKDLLELGMEIEDVFSNQ